MRRALGFTLIEIVVVIALIGVLATVGFQTLGNGTRLADLLAAEDRVLAELRRARSAALYELPAIDSDGTGETVEVANIANVVGGDASVCPVEVSFSYADFGAADGVTCNGCLPCPSSAPWTVTIELGNEQSCLSIADSTGRAQRVSCDSN